MSNLINFQGEMVNFFLKNLVLKSKTVDNNKMRKGEKNLSKNKKTLLK